LNRYSRNGIEVEALRVQRPYRVVSQKFPRSHLTDRPSGAINYFRLIDAPEGRNRAKPGDWIVKYAPGLVEVFTHEEFTAQFEPVEQNQTEQQDHPVKRGKRIQARTDQALD
jgi:hypothetical protein